MCQELKRIMVAKTRRRFTNHSKRQHITIVAECSHGLPLYYAYHQASGTAYVKQNKLPWSPLDFMRWPEEVKDFLAGEGYRRPERPKKPKPSPQVLAAVRAIDNLKKWQRRLKLATTKVKKYAKSVNRYKKLGVIKEKQ